MQWTFLRSFAVNSPQFIHFGHVDLVHHIPTQTFNPIHKHTRKPGSPYTSPSIHRIEYAHQLLTPIRLGHREQVARDLARLAQAEELHLCPAVPKALPVRRSTSSLAIFVSKRMCLLRYATDKDAALILVPIRNGCTGADVHP